MASLIEQLLGGQTVSPRQAQQQQESLGNLLSFLSASTQHQPVNIPSIPSSNYGGGSGIGRSLLMGAIAKKAAESDAEDRKKYLDELPKTRFEGPTGNQVPLTAMEQARQYQSAPYSDLQGMGNDMIKSIYMKQVGADNVTPYYTPVETSDGIQSFDNRTGKFSAGINPVTGQPFIKSSSNPDLQYRLKEAQQAGAESATVRDIQTPEGRKDFIQGSPITGYKNLGTIEDNNAPRSLPPKPWRNGDQSGGMIYLEDQGGWTNINPQQSIRQQSRGYGPSLAEQEAVKTQAAINERAAKDALDIKKTGNEKAAALINNAKLSQPLLEDIMTLLPKAASGWASSKTMGAMNVLGIPTARSEAQGKLNIAADTLTSNIPRAAGSQSNIELEFARKQAGDLNNADLPYETRLAAAKYMYERNQKILKGEEVPPPKEATDQPQYEYRTVDGKTQRRRIN
jgi:hypothetical protein